jgi:hypothetical protein
VTVANRWGKIVYEAAYYANDWSGNDLAPGTYFLTVKHPCLAKGYGGWLMVVK